MTNEFIQVLEKQRKKLVEDQQTILNRKVQHFSEIEQELVINQMKLENHFKFQRK